MSNPLTMPQALGGVPLNELLNVAHERPFSLLFTNYSWLLGIAGGITLIWVVFAWRGRRDWNAFTLAMPLTVVMVMTGFLNVLSEVQQPSRLVYGYLYGWTYWDTAIIKYGITLLPLLLIGAWWLSFQSLDRAVLNRTIERLPSRLQPLADVISLWSRHWSLEERPRLYRSVLALMFLLGLFAPMYSGIFLMSEHGVPVWNSPAQALIFLALGVAKGAVVLMLLVPLLWRLATGERMPLDTALRPVAATSVAVALVIWAGWMWWLGRFGTVPDLRAASLFTGPYAQAIFWHWWVIGALIPLVLLLSPLNRIKASLYIAALGVLWGSYAVRFFIVIGGQALNRSGASYLAFQPNDHVLWFTGFNLLFVAGLLALLMWIIAEARVGRPEPFTAGGSRD